MRSMVEGERGHWPCAPSVGFTAISPVKDGGGTHTG